MTLLWFLPSCEAAFSPPLCLHSRPAAVHFKIKMLWLCWVHAVWVYTTSIFSDLLSTLVKFLRILSPTIQNGVQRVFKDLYDFVQKIFDNAFNRIHNKSKVGQVFKLLRQKSEKWEAKNPSFVLCFEHNDTHGPAEHILFFSVVCSVGKDGTVPRF